MKLFRSGKRFLVIPLVMAIVLLGGAAKVLLAVCVINPFTDVPLFLCPFVDEMWALGITAGTSPITYSPDDPVTRGQMAVFIPRAIDRALRRGSRQAALDQFWTPQNAQSLGLTTVGTSPVLIKSDGADVWVANYGGSTVSRVRASDGKLLETWTGANQAQGVLVAMGRVFVTGNTTPGILYRIDPSQPAGAVTTVASNLGVFPFGIAFDGSRIWTANGGPPGSVSIVTPGATLPWSVTTVTTGFVSPRGVVYDGANIWVADILAGLKKLDSNGGVLQTVPVGSPQFPIFDGTNIWIPDFSGSVRVVRASTGTVLATLTGNGLNRPNSAAFDGERILVTNEGGNSVSLWKAADLTPLGSVSTGIGTNPYGACSDGLNFWVTLSSAGQLARF